MAQLRKNIARNHGKQFFLYFFFAENICIQFLLFYFRERFDDVFSDKLPHLYRLVLRPDNSFYITIDGKVVNEGSLLLDFTPPVNPPQEIPDPDDVKPENWDDREKVYNWSITFS